MGTELRTRPAETPDTDPWFYGWRYVERRNADGTTTSEQVPLTAEDVLHPEEEDFIVHNEIHDDLTAYLKAVIRWRLANHPGARVFHDHRIAWQTGGVRPMGPDIALFFDTGPWDPNKGTYPVRDEGARPGLVIEVTSPSTRAKDLDQKIALYCRAEVPRYIVVDLMAGEDESEIRLLVFDYSPDGPVPVELPEPHRVWIPELELWLTIEGDRVDCRETDGTSIGDYVEVAQAAAAEKARADEEKARADRRRDRKIAALEAEIQRLRKECGEVA